MGQRDIGARAYRPGRKGTRSVGSRAYRHLAQWLTVGGVQGMCFCQVFNGRLHFIQRCIRLATRETQATKENQATGDVFVAF